MLISLVKTIIIQRINPDIEVDLESFLSREHSIRQYSSTEELSIAIKQYEKSEGKVRGSLLIDYNYDIPQKYRNGFEIISDKTTVKAVASVEYTIVNEVKGSGNIEHLFLVTSNISHNKLLGSVLYKVFGVDPFLRVTFSFTSSNHQRIENVFDDVVKIRGDDITDQHLRNLAVTGSRIFDSTEYIKAFTGEIMYLGLQMDSQWFIVNKNGRITIYRTLSDEAYVNFIIKIVSKLLSVGAVNL